MHNEIDYIKVGKRIRDARKSMHITQESLSEMCGCTQQAHRKSEKDIPMTCLPVRPAPAKPGAGRGL